MKKIVPKIYAIYTIIALIIGFLANRLLKELNVMGRSINIELWMLSFLVLFTSGISFVAVQKFCECKTILKKQAKKVGIEDSMLKNNDRLIEAISQNSLFYIALGIGSIFAGIFIVNASTLDLVQFSKFYAYVLVIVLFFITAYAYIYFFIILIYIRDVYRLNFRNYTYMFPVATDIFEKYTQICSMGLIFFWIVGLLLVALSIIVFDEQALLLMAFIGILILIGYMIFTFYPYYITRKKVSMLKLQTIKKLCEKHDMRHRDEFEHYSAIVKYVFDSPGAMSTEFQIILTSSLAAIATLLSPFLTLFS